jgi:hypothetical protein
MLWPDPVAEWGSTETERAAAFPCDRHLRDPDQEMFRAVEVDAPQEVVFRWLCQLRAAPYSYDRLDNFGRRSPQELTPGLEDLEVGQRAMTVFRLVEFDQGRSLTFLSSGPLFGRVACTYRAEAVDERRSRIVVKLLVAYPRRLYGPLLRFVLPPGDLMMMRRQLLNLKELAERTAASQDTPVPAGA